MPNFTILTFLKVVKPKANYRDFNQALSATKL